MPNQLSMNCTAVFAFWLKSVPLCMDLILHGSMAVDSNNAFHTCTTCQVVFHEHLPSR